MGALEDGPKRHEGDRAPTRPPAAPSSQRTKSMTLLSTKLRYGVVAQAFHWVTVVLLATAWLVAHGGSRPLHMTLGFTVFVIVAARLLWRAVDRRPAHDSLSPVVALGSRLVHWLLYAMLIAIPVSAIAGTWLGGHPIVVYGLDLGPYVGASRALGRQIMEIHELLANAIVVVAGLHAVAALFHHFFVKDDVLRTMLPGGRAA
jgi:cytochrome b561